jgi:hypothetical protein
MKVGDLVRVRQRRNPVNHPTLGNPAFSRRGVGVVVFKLRNLVHVLWDDSRPKPIAVQLLEVIDEKVSSGDVGSLSTKQVSNHGGSLSRSGSSYDASR